MATDNDYKIGIDTEKWFMKTIEKQCNTIRMKHMGDKKFDFIGVVNGNKKFFLDVKFYMSEYRIKGWTEVFSWKHDSGIFVQSRQTDDMCLLALLHKGEYHIIDVKKLQKAIDRKELKVREGTTWDNGRKCPVKYVVMNDFNDDRFCLFSGKMDKEVWSSFRKVSTLKNMDVDAWFTGRYKEINARPLQTDTQTI